MLEENISNTKSEQDSESQSVDKCRKSRSSAASYLVEYGPIRVRHRRNTSQTLATGRRSKDEPIYGDEAIKRNLRRAKNRTAARSLKISRDKIALDLVEKIKELEEEKVCLQDQHKKLEERKAQLNRALYNVKQAPLIPLITDIDIPILFGPQQRNDLLIDLQPLLKNIGENFCLSDR